MKCMKSLRSRLCLRVLPLFLSCIVFLSSTIGIRAEEITPTPGAYNGTWTMNTEDFLELFWDSAVREMAKMYIVGSDAIFGEFQHFLTWLEGDPNYGVLEQYPNTVIHSPVPPTGNTYQDIDNSTSVDIPVPVQNTILQFIQYQVAENPLGYDECYITSYNFMTASVFPTYQMYATTKEYIKNHDGYAFFVTWDISYGNVSACHIMTLPHDLNLGWIGTTNQGIFTNVHPYIDWQILTGSNLNNYVSSKVKITANGDIQTSNAGIANNISFSNANGLSASGSPSYYMVYSSFDKNELVYVFDTLNSYKNYNAGLPQDYYLTSEGLDHTNWTVSGSGSINTGSMTNSGNYYNSVVNEVGTGWTPEQILQLVDMITNNGGSGGSGSGGSGSDNTGLWKGIGEAIGSLITGIATIVSEVAGALSNAILSIINIFVGEDGLFAKLTDLINVGFQNFLSGVFSWMPPEIVTLFTATLIFGIFFAIWKMLRG